MRQCLATLFTIVFVAAAAARADVKLPALFSDHMVLQAGVEVPVWGWAAPGEQVSVSVAGQKMGAIAGADGKWMVRFSAIRASDEPIEMTVTGKNSITIHDILVGDVWLASGQSNMEFALKQERNGKEETPRANHPKIRFFRVPFGLANDPQADCVAKWEICTPESAADFSAVAYYFAVDLQAKLGAAIGVIGSYQGGSIAQGWTSIEGFRGQENLKPFIEDYEAAKLKSAPLVVKYEQAVEKWEKAQKDWEERVKAAQAEGKLAPPPPKGKKPQNRALFYQTPSLMFNAMTAPLVPYGIKGVIWYQGESDAHNMAEVTRYRLVFPNLIKDWRRLWSDEKLPFLFVQLPNYRKRLPEPGDSVWAAMREVQTQTLAIGGTGMAVTIDLADVDRPENIHPRDKVDVSNRLSLVALRTVYGKNVIAAGPKFSKMTVEANMAKLSFDQVGGGLVIGTSPAQLSDQAPPQPDKPLGFTIAGADMHFVWAQARIEPSGSVVVWSDKVAVPVAVRYGWADNPEVNLYSKEGLPALPFRTDDWPLSDPPAPVKPPGK